MCQVASSTDQHLSLLWTTQQPCQHGISSHGVKCEGQLGWFSTPGRTLVQGADSCFPTPVKQVACGSRACIALCQDSVCRLGEKGKMGKLGLLSDLRMRIPATELIRTLVLSAVIKASIGFSNEIVTCCFWPNNSVVREQAPQIYYPRGER
jgi:hypothetical protein